MLSHRLRNTRYAIVPAAIATALVLASTAPARAGVGFHVDIALPPGVHVSVGNYEPYYVGRVYYQPLQHWRPVYSFPVDTPYGVIYQPYVYDAGRVVCHDFIPGPEAGYGQIVVEGRGYYDPHWYGGHGQYRAYNRYDGRGYHDYHGGQRWDNASGRGRGNGYDHGSWQRDDHSGHGKGGKNKKHKH